METNAILAVGSKLATAGLSGGNELELLSTFCSACCDAGLPLGRAVTFMGTLHPIFEEKAFRWDWKEPVESISE